MTEPLTPLDCDLRDWPSMLLDVVRLRDSGLASDETPEACWAAVLLWAAAWHQVPAASIPDNDIWIAKHAGYAQRGKVDRRAWSRVRDGALRLFVRCSDGRLYHPVVAEKALEVWLSKLASRLSSGAGNAKRWKTEFDPKPIEEQMRVAREMLRALNPQSSALHKRKPVGVPTQSEDGPAGTPALIPPGSQEKGKGSEQDSEPIGSAAAGAAPAVDKSTRGTPAPAARPADPGAKRAAWNGCGKWMVENGVADDVARTFMGLVLKDHPEVALDALVAAPKNGATVDPKGWLKATAQRLDAERKAAAGSKHPTPTAAETAATEAQRRAEFEAEQADPAGQAAVAAARERLATTRGRIEGAEVAS